jgi:Putative addiction module component
LQNAGIVATIASMIDRIPELRTLSRAEKLAPVTELWDDLGSNLEDIPITPAQIAGIERRNTVRTPILGLLGKKLRQEFWGSGANFIKCMFLSGE